MKSWKVVAAVFCIILMMMACSNDEAPRSDIVLTGTVTNNHSDGENFVSQAVVVLVKSSDVSQIDSLQPVEDLGFTQK